MKFKFLIIDKLSSLMKQNHEVSNNVLILKWT